MSLNWDREALNNGDGPPTVVSYDEDGNELFWAKKVHSQWKAYISYGPERGRLASQKIAGIFPSRESAEKICEHFHKLAEINHGY